MGLNEQEKSILKRELVRCLETEQEVRKIVIFGSFPHAANPHDLDVASPKRMLGRYPERIQEVRPPSSVLRSLILAVTCNMATSQGWHRGKM
jgi:hypothetical protein